MTNYTNRTKINRLLGYSALKNRPTEEILIYLKLTWSFPIIQMCTLLTQCFRQFRMLNIVGKILPHVLSAQAV